MLPNHSPYVVAEQYGTLETLYPNRVELGLGRAPGTDMQTAAALRRGRNSLDFLRKLRNFEVTLKIAILFQLILPQACIYRFIFWVPALKVPILWQSFGLPYALLHTLRHA